jgi:hypothetical protein
MIHDGIRALGMLVGAYVWTTVLLMVWRYRLRGDFGVGVFVGLLAGGLLMGVLSVAFGIVP